MKTKLNVGSGRRPKATLENEWIDLDIRSNIKSEHGIYTPDIVADCRKIPRPDNSFELVYAHSVLEHFSKWERMDCLKEWYRVCKVGGKVWISVPDMQLLAKALLYIPNELIMRFIYGEHNYVGNEHKWGYIKETIKADLEQVGFTQIKISPPSRYPYELIVEAVK